MKHSNGVITPSSQTVLVLNQEGAKTMAKRLPLQYLVCAQSKPVNKLPEQHPMGVIYGPFDTPQEAIDWIDKHPTLRDGYTWVIVPNRILGK